MMQKKLQEEQAFKAIHAFRQALECEANSSLDRHAGFLLSQPNGPALIARQVTGIIEHNEKRRNVVTAALKTLIQGIKTNIIPTARPEDAVRLFSKELEDFKSRQKPIRDNDPIFLDDDLMPEWYAKAHPNRIAFQEFLERRLKK